MFMRRMFGGDGRKRLYAWTVGCEVGRQCACTHTHAHTHTHTHTHMHGDWQACGRRLARRVTHAENPRLTPRCSPRLRSAQLAVDGERGEVVITRIARGTPAHFCGRLAEGDRLISINGEPLASTDLELWQAWWLDEDLGSPMWLKVAPYSARRTGETAEVCVVRCGEDALGQRTPSAGAREGCVGVEFDSTGSARVSHLEEGGAAWLALLKPAQIPPPLLAGDVITIIDGDIVGEGGAARAKGLLSGPAFSRVHLSVARKGAVVRTVMVRSPQLTGAEMDDAGIPMSRPPRMCVCVCVCVCVCMHACLRTPSSTVPPRLPCALISHVPMTARDRRAQCATGCISQDPTGAASDAKEPQKHPHCRAAAHRQDELRS